MKRVGGTQVDSLSLPDDSQVENGLRMMKFSLHFAHANGILTRDSVGFSLGIKFADAPPV